MVRIVLINLDRDADRLDWMSAQLGRLGLPFERFAAVRGDALPPALARYFRDAPATARPLSIGEIGCYASHLAIMEEVVTTGAAATLVLEDDLALDADLLKVLDAVDRLPADWDLVRLAGLGSGGRVRVASLAPGLDLVKYVSVPMGNGAYLVSHKGAVKYVEWARGRTLVDPIDHDLHRVWNCRMTTYGVSPDPVRQNVLDGSSIDAIAESREMTRVGTHPHVDPAGRIARLVYNLGNLGPRLWIRTTATRAAARWSKRLNARRRPQSA
ncbi:glycosyltransferase family 25 protein [Caulobacter sp. 17J80-11]|uniref:glycosyltransferase family 25 protein n=1 Tax=Caulobacter sp. 17J80-11 TaxID=2763502 RepID=UPI00165350A4|nr:glycosyltransferase family 25 protein [Caulobacter sp. 17J80-11]MBC6981837.1 glycosyltransferase family 25 protein [Caulobacter sp. 17J80-11]